MIGQIVKKWQQFFAIQDDGGRYGRHLELWLLRFFRRYRCVLNQSSNIPTKFGDDWSNCKEKANVFRNQDGGGRHLELWLLRFFDITDVF